MLRRFPRGRGAASVRTDENSVRRPLQPLVHQRNLRADLARELLRVGSVVPEEDARHVAVAVGGEGVAFGGKGQAVSQLEVATSFVRGLMVSSGVG